MNPSPLSNPYAAILANHALKRLTWFHKSWPEDIDMLKCGTQDYLDLMKVARMIERGETEAKICRALWSFDTIVRESIPNKVWRKFFD